MIFTTVNISSSLSFTLGELEYQLQEILDQILVGILPLTATLISFYFVRKKVSANKIIIGIIIVGSLLSLLGIL